MTNSRKVTVELYILPLGSDSLVCRFFSSYNGFSIKEINGHIIPHGSIKQTKEEQDSSTEFENSWKDTKS